MSIEKRNTRVFSTSRAMTVTNIYLSDEVGYGDEFIEELQVLKEAQAGDEVHIFINSPGGNVATALQLVNNIDVCEATVVGHIEGICHSAASYIFLACHDWVVNSNCLMLIHNYSGGAYGKGHDLVTGVQETNKWIANIMRDTYLPFLTEEELHYVESKDLYLNSIEISERLANVKEQRESLAIVEQKDMLKDTITKFQGLLDDEKQDSEGVPESTYEQQTVPGS